MSKGGNKKFREFLLKYNMIDMNIKKKYLTKAAKYYREYLDSLCKGESPAKAPSNSEGKEPVESRSNNFEIKISGFGSDDMYPHEQSKKRKRSKSKFKESWQKGKKKMEQWGSNISKKFGKIFRRSKSKKKSRKSSKSEEEKNDDISESNDSYFEIKKMRKKKKNLNRFAVSYTHLTLPTICSV